MIFVQRFPTTINHSEYYQYLDFDKNDLHRELERLVAMELNLDRSLQSNYNDLKNNVWKPRLEKLIEKCAMEKIYWAAALKKGADSSKRRHVIRAKMSNVMKCLKTLVQDYCYFFNLDDVENVYADCGRGVFSWQSVPESEFEGTATDRRLCVEAVLKKNHLVEERALLLTDMNSYLKFYNQKATVLKEKLKSSESDIACTTGDSLHENRNQSDVDLQNSEDNLSDSAGLGTISLLKKGLNDCPIALQEGVLAFGHFLDPKLLCEVDEIDEEEEEEENILGTDDLAEVDAAISEVSNVIDDLEWNVELISTVGNELCQEFLTATCQCITVGKTSMYHFPYSCCQSRQS